VGVGETVTSGVDVGVGVTQPAKQASSRQIMFCGAAQKLDFMFHFCFSILL